MSLRRDTAQQRAIRQAIETAGRPLSVQEIHTLALEQTSSLGLRTVYRILNRLTEDGSVVPVMVPGQSDRYEPAAVATKHHHHFHCDSCDRVFDVGACPGGLNRLLPPGFELSGHELTLWGLCVDCAG